MGDVYVVSKWNDAVRKSRLLVLTGAGASAPLGMPPMNAFHKHCDGNLVDTLRLICKPFTGDYVDLEFALSRLDLYEQEVAPDLFKAGFLHSVLGVGGDRAAALKKESARLKLEIRKKIIELYGELDDGQSSKAVDLYSFLLMQLRVYCENRPDVLPIFTTNYDLTFEALGDRDPTLRFITGMRPRLGGSQWDPRVYEEDADANFAVFRLHGCSHWFERKSDKSIWFQRFPDLLDEEKKGPKILYPEPGKDNRLEERPFATSYQYLRECLASAKRVVIIGYSGRDAAIQNYIEQSLSRDEQKQFVVVTKSDVFPDGLARVIPSKNLLAHIRGGFERSRDRIIQALEGKLPKAATVSIASLKKTYERDNDPTARDLPAEKQCQCDECKEYRARTS